MLKKCGYDAVFIKGISDKPVYIFIDNGEVEIRDASNLWGKTIKQTEAELKNELAGSKFNAAIIGPAGENLSYMAAIMNDSHRAAARGGSGAVMGSKKLKAVVVRGNQKSQIFDDDAVAAINRTVVDSQKNGPMAQFAAGTSEYGTSLLYTSSCLSGDSGIKNWSSSSAADYPEELANSSSAVTHDAKYKIKRFACANCPLGCGAIYNVNEGKWPVNDTGRPEYETLAAFGANLLNPDFYSIIMCNELCNEYGFDTISLGGTVAWAMECYNKGILSKAELDGIDLTWGNEDAIVELTEKIVHGEGCGAILKNGSEYAAKKFGKGFECLVVAGGIEIGQHDGRQAGGGWSRIYRYDPTPGRHTKGGTSLAPMHPEYRCTGYDDMLAMALTELINASGLCVLNQFAGVPGLAEKYLNAITGFNLSKQEIVNIGLRSFTIRQAFNLREGMKRKDFTSSERVYKTDENMTGPLAGVNVDIELLGDNLFNALGWDMDMVPSRAALDMVGGLDSVIADLYPEQ